MGWSDEWPAAAGEYWLYGWIYKDEYVNPPKFHFVKVRKIRDGFMYVCEGQFVFKNDSAKGKWQPVVFPDPPVLE